MGRDVVAYHAPALYSFSTSTSTTYSHLHNKTTNATRLLVNSNSIPGLKTSTVFFTALRTNLLSEPHSSPMATPPSMRPSEPSLPPPSPSAGPMLTLDTTVSATPLMSHVNPLAGVPELKSYLVTDDFEKREALKLVADSVAQQRQAANRALLYHPLNMAVAVAVLGALVQFLAHRGYDALMIGMTCIGLLMAAMAACRYATQEYIHAAEDINFRWLGDADILVSTFGDEIIGTVMIEWKSGESRTKKKKAWRGLIRAWTTKLKYRGNGVGAALLEDAVKHSKKKGAEALDFSTHHANSRRVLPKLYNGAFDRSERRAMEKLVDLTETSPVRGKGKRRLTN